MKTALLPKSKVRGKMIRIRKGSSSKDINIQLESLPIHLELNRSKWV